MNLGLKKIFSSELLALEDQKFSYGVTMELQWKNVIPGINSFIFNWNLIKLADK